MADSTAVVVGQDEDGVIAMLIRVSTDLVEARDLQQVKKVLDIARAAELYARRQGMSKDTVMKANVVAIDAEVMLGGALAAMEKNTGAMGVGTSAVPIKNRTLKQLRINKKTSTRAQRLHKIAQADAEKIQKIKTSEVKVTKALREEEAKDRRKRRAENATELAAQSVPLEGLGKFPLIYVDPPWRYEYITTDTRAIENQYPTMSQVELFDLPVPDHCLPDCTILMWATSPKLEEGLSLMRGWGFAYRTCAVWDKEIIGMGYYFRQQHELLLVGVKGTPVPPDPAHRPGSVFRSRREHHSAKPDGVYDMIDVMFPDIPKLELFMRGGGVRPGWTAWGFEAPVIA